MGHRDCKSIRAKLRWPLARAIPELAYENSRLAQTSTQTATVALIRQTKGLALEAKETQKDEAFGCASRRYISDASRSSRCLMRATPRSQGRRVRQHSRTYSRRTASRNSCLTA